MENGAIVSIIIPVFNVKPYLREALDSVIRQTYKDLEILIIDDGSTDGSGMICDEYAEMDRRIRVFHQENKGLSAARNVGLDNMNGEAAAFLDPDDFYDVTFIEKLMSAMTGQNADIVLCKYSVSYSPEMREYTDRNKKIPKAGPGLYDRISGLQALSDGTINIHLWNRLYRQELFEKIRFPEGHVHEDIAVSFKLFDKCETIYVLDEPLYLYRYNSESISHTYSASNIKDDIMGYSYWLSFIEKNIPEIFTPIHLKSRQQKYIKVLLLSYLLFSGKNGKHEDKLFREELRKKIIADAGTFGLSTFRFKTKTALLLLDTCPWLLEIIYPVNSQVNHLRKKLFRK